MIVFDENVPHQLADFLRALGEPAAHVSHLGLVATTDEEILRALNVGIDCLVTKDKSMLGRPEIVAIARDRQLGMFFLPQANLTAIHTSQLVIRSWGHILAASRTEHRPFYGAVALASGPVRIARRPGGL